MREAGTVRCRLPFRTINRAADPGYQPGMQRHHLLPRQLLTARCFEGLFNRLGPERVGFDDFRRNGLLLPCTERAVMGFRSAGVWTGVMVSPWHVSLCEP